MNPTQWINTVLERAEMKCQDSVLGDGKMIKVIVIAQDDGDLDVEEIEELAQTNLRKLAKTIREVDGGTF